MTISTVVTLSDAEVIVRWLNASKRARSHDRVIAIREQLGQLHQGTVTLQQQLRDLRAKVKAIHGHKGKSATRELGAEGAAHKQLWQRLNRQHRKLNAALSRYTFRIGLGYSASTDSRRGGLVPDNDKSYFEMKIDDSVVSEPDAVMALVRLFLIGELHRVRLCEMCKETWRVAAKAHYRFCSPECRQDYYANTEEYKARKKRNQKNYRDREKQKAQTWS
jgi:hypothetical protein